MGNSRPFWKTGALKRSKTTFCAQAEATLNTSVQLIKVFVRIFVRGRVETAYLGGV
jgi:hypothetical protein